MNCAIFMQMGFSWWSEIETEYNNFTGLNIPFRAPSRDVFDTFYLKGKDKLLLRSHTSPVQIRNETANPHWQCCPAAFTGRTLLDASHFMFHQIEALWWMKIYVFGFKRCAWSCQSYWEISRCFRPHFSPFTGFPPQK